MSSPAANGVDVGEDVAGGQRTRTEWLSSETREASRTLGSELSRTGACPTLSPLEPENR